MQWDSSKADGQYKKVSLAGILETMLAQSSALLRQSKRRLKVEAQNTDLHTDRTDCLERKIDEVSAGL